MRIEWSDAAKRDRYELLTYLASVSPLAALDADDRIDHVVEILAIFPFAGRLGRLRGTRELVIGGTRYIATYQVEENAVVVLRLFDASRDWPPKG